MKKLIGLLILWLSIIEPTVAMSVNREEIESAYRLKLSSNSTIDNPTYFACFVRQSKTHPGLSKWNPGLRFTHVFLTNYAQNTKGFGGVGTLLTTSGYLNSHYFKAYHDEDFPKSASGFVDAFVLWAGFNIECRDITASVKLPPNSTHKQFSGPIIYKHHGKNLELHLAGSDYT